MTAAQVMPAAVFAGEGRLDITERPHPELLAPSDVVLAVERCGGCACLGRRGHGTEYTR